MNLRVAVCDDDSIICNDIKNRIEKVYLSGFVDTYYNGKDLLEEKNNYDIVFLDIQMPDINGLEVARLMRERGYKGYIIFITSYSTYMQTAFKVKAFRYLDKACSDKELEETFKDIEKDLTENINIEVNTGKENVYIKIHDIIYIEAYGDGTYIYTEDGKVVESRKTLKYWCEMLEDNGFYKTHKSFLISLQHVIVINDNGVIMRNIKNIVPISRRNRKGLRIAMRKNTIEYFMH